MKRGLPGAPSPRPPAGRSPYPRFALTPPTYPNTSPRSTDRGRPVPPLLVRPDARGHQLAARAVCRGAAGRCSQHPAKGRSPLRFTLWEQHTQEREQVRGGRHPAIPFPVGSSGDHKPGAVRRPEGLCDQLTLGKTHGEAQIRQHRTQRLLLGRERGWGGWMDWWRHPPLPTTVYGEVLHPGRPLCSRPTRQPTRRPPVPNRRRWSKPGSPATCGPYRSGRSRGSRPQPAEQGVQRPARSPPAPRPRAGTAG